MLPLRAFIDIGGAAATADAFTIWIVQCVGNEVRVLDYYESWGQVLAFHVNWLRSRGYHNAVLYLPHDGIAANNITGKRYEDHLRDAGFAVEPPVKNQGKGAAMMRIEALRRLGPQLAWSYRHKWPLRSVGSMKRPPRPAAKRSASTTSARTTPATSASARSTTGHRMICWEQPGRAGAFNRVIKYADGGWV